jgi:hypothetical protein
MNNSILYSKATEEILSVIYNPEVKSPKYYGRQHVGCKPLTSIFSGNANIVLRQTF